MGPMGFMGFAPVGSKGKAPGQGVAPAEADDITTFETPNIALFCIIFHPFFVINCDIKTVANTSSNYNSTEDKTMKVERCLWWII